MNQSLTHFCHTGESMDIKINEMYNCEPLSDYDYSTSSLAQWYNEIIKKDITQITSFDVIRMLRQKVFIEVAVEKAIDYLNENPFEGDFFEGELLKLLLSMEKKYIDEKKEDILLIINNAKKRIENHQWLFEDDKKKFNTLISSFDIYSK